VLDDDLDPASYKRLTGTSKESYEQRLLVAAQASMMGEVTVEPDDAPPYTRLGILERGSVDDVSLDVDGADAALIVLFRAHDRPGCRFGWRIPIWPAPPPDDPEMGTPEGCAFILSINLEEIVEAPTLPPCDPDPKTITWLGN
jgi:hypothetical protein